MNSNTKKDIIKNIILYFKDGYQVGECTDELVPVINE